ncbi:MAG: SusC/RagA family TonB-linked outer membrane protein, partial [Bacteroidota bacterium]
ELDSEEISTVKSYNVANSLVGKVAGVNVNQSGGLGSGSRIVIRGNNSITGANQALIVVDGVPINTAGSDSGGSVYSSTVTGGGITDINADDVESISVLKGPNAAALYGSRAANGVLLITTKKGRMDETLGVSLTSNFTMGNAMFLPDYQNEYGQGENGDPYIDLDGMTGSSWGSKLDGSQQLYYTGENKAYTAQKDNVEDYFKTSTQIINTLSLSKGGDDYSVRFSYTNNITTSILPNSELNSHNFNLRSMVNLSDKLSFDGKATYFTQELNNRVQLGSEGVLGYVYYMPRNIITNDLRKYQMDNPALYDPFAKPEPLNDYDVISYAGTNKSIGNPYWIQNNDVNDERRGRFIGFAKLDYQFTDWLSAFVRVGGDVTNIRTDEIQKVGHHFRRWGRVTYSNSQYTEFNSDFLLKADKELTDNLSLNAMVGGNLSIRTAESMRVRGEQFKIPTRAFLANTNVQTNSHNPVATKKVNSLYASASLSYDDFMYLDVTGRNDWSSTLGSDNRSYFYPSVSYSILLDKFIDPDHEFMNLFKLRASWAEVGNDTDAYQLYQTFDVPSEGYLGLTTLNSPTVKFKPDLKPESIVSSEFGMEGKFFQNRLYFDFSVYKINTTDMIFNVPVPPATGYQFFKENVGEVENKGIEFLIGGVPVQTDDFRWDVSFNFSKNENKLIELIDGLDSFVLNTSNSGNVSIRAEVGGSIGDIYGTKWKTDENGQLLVTEEGFPQASSTREYLGNSNPDWTGGLSNSFTYKNVSLRFLIDARFGGEIYSSTSSRLDGSGVSERSLLYRDGGVVIDAINEGTGVQNTENITSQQYWGPYSSIGSEYVYDQTNIRLREFALTYNLPSEYLTNSGFAGASFGLIGRNLFFFHKEADDIDPEANLGTSISGQGISANNVPTVRSLGLNINLKF